MEPSKIKCKQTEVEWMPEIPISWGMKRAKTIFLEKSNKGFPDAPLLMASQKEGVVLKDMLEQKGMEAVQNFETFKLVEIDDFVISLRSFEGGIELAYNKGIISPVYTIFSFRNPEKHSIDYYKYLFKTQIFIQELNVYKTGIRDGQSINFNKFENISLPVPPFEEQKKLANYIGIRIEKINHFIQQKQRLIELLKEQRQSIINEAVTKGINPNVKMRASGIEWIGDIPEHWEVRRLKDVADVVLGKMLCSENKGGYYLKPYLKSKNIGWSKVLIDEIDEMWFSIKELKTYRIRINDLLVSEGGEVGKTCIWKEELNECYIQNSVHKLTCFEDCLPEFYLFWMSMLGTVGHFKSIVNQVSIAHLTREKIVNVICLYPSLKEQQQIVEHIKTETATIDIAIAKAEKEIELIKEYKEAMISEVVLGKIDVKSVEIASATPKKEANWEFKEAVLISVLTDKFGSLQYPLGRKRYTKFSYLFHRHTDNRTEGYLHKAAGPYNPKTKYAGPEKIALQNRYVEGRVNGNYSGFVAGSEISNAKNYFEKYWDIDALNWIEQFRKKTNDELELYTTVDKAMVELAENKKEISLQTVKQVIDEHPEWKPKLEQDLFNDKNIVGAIEFLKQLFV